MQSWRNFWKGRYSKGNTYLNDNSENPVAAVSEQWFQQNLDHFDPTNTKTWQQVSQAMNCNRAMNIGIFLTALLLQREVSQGRWTGVSHDRW